ncbi:MAG: hypothetical protein HKL80_05565 [Acidimicrobiales bacterium]|nr:hypothetical protein [Acidimicrobiales bacterium]
MIASLLILTSLFTILELNNATRVAQALQTSLRWTSSFVDHQSQNTGGIQLNGISCIPTTPSTCVAVDAEGNVLVSTNSVVPSSWKISSVDPGTSINSVTCVSAAWCLAIDSKGNIVIISNPGPTTSFYVTASGATSPLNAVSCPSTNLCLVTDSSGDILVSSNPTSIGTWVSTNVDGSDSILSLSCPSISQCFAGDDAGNILHSTNAGMTTWSSASVDATNLITAISCTSTTQCVAGDSGGNVLVSTTPNSSTWQKISLPNGNSIESLSCSSNHCVATNNFGSIFVTTDLAFTQWSATTLINFIPITASDCLSSGFCILGDQIGDIFTSTNPTGGVSAWPKYALDGKDKLTAFTCDSGGSCLFGDDAGDIGYSANPILGAPSWVTTNIDGTNTITSLQCPSPSFCVGSDNLGNFLYSNSPKAANWTAENIDGVYDVTSVTCVSSTFCAATDNVGNVLVSNNPEVASSWSVQDIEGAVSVSGISCPSSTLCLAVDSSGSIFYNTTPTVLSSTWIPMDVDGTNTITSIDCVSIAMCVAADYSGNVLVSIDPTGGASAWSSFSLGSASITSLSCPSSTTCYFSDLGGIVHSTSSITAPISWTTNQVTSNGPLNSIYCTGPTTCYGTDNLGNIYVGIETPPAEPFQSISPTRICDTRLGAPFPANPCNSNGTQAGTLNAGSTIDLQIAGVAGVPSTGATAVVLNVTVTDTTASSFLTVYPSQSTLPLASNLNWIAGQTIANSVTVALGPDGSINLTNAFGSTDVVVDIQGYYGPNSAPSPQGQFHSVTPARICDTRSTMSSNQCNSNGNGTLGPNGTLSVAVAGYGGVSSTGAQDVVLNVTVANTTASSYLTVYPAGSTMPLVSNLNWSAGDTIANQVIVPLSSTGDINIYNFKGNADVIVDVSGWFSNSTATGTPGGLFMPYSPERICDTRINYSPNQCNDYGTQDLAITPGNTLNVQVVGAGQIYGFSLISVVANVTATNTSAAGFLSQYPIGTTDPGTSCLNWSPGQTIPNSITASINRGTIEGISFQSPVSSTDLVVDISGVYLYIV